LDFDLVTSGTAFRIGFDVPNGGSKNITWNNFQIQDSRGTSLASTLFHFESGPTGASPSQTSAFMEINGGRIIKYNNTSGVARHLENVSQVTFNNWYDEFELGCATALKIETSININTGVFNFNNCDFRSKVTPVDIIATSQLIDTVNFFGGFIANDEQALARECIKLSGAAGIANLNISGPHIECRDATNNAVVRVTGLLLGFNILCHASGSATASPNYFLHFDSGSETFGGTIQDGSEFLRIVNGSSGGAIVRFENDVVTHIEYPVVVGAFTPNTTLPHPVNVETGVNEETIYKSVISQPIFTAGARLSTGRDRVYTLEDSATPSVKGGNTFNIPGSPTNTSITDFVDEYKGQELTIINTGGSSITIVTGASTIRLEGFVNYVMAGNDTLTLVRTGDNHWIEKSRSNT
jgi:hypothetical protein